MAPRAGVRRRPASAAAALAAPMALALPNPGAADVDRINRFGRKHFGGSLECSWSPNKGRLVCATQRFRQGDLILVEDPLHAVQAEPRSQAFRKLEQLCAKHPDDFDYEPLWYWCALRSLTPGQLKGALAGGWEGIPEERQELLLLLHREEEPMESSPGASSRLLVKSLAPSANPALIDALTQAWVLNCFEYSDDPEGFCTYFYSSFMSHSCLPNAFWHYDGDRHVLRAREDIAIGDEVCISYLSEEWLLRSGPQRRWDLYETKRFWCACPRCDSDRDLSRGFHCPKCYHGTVFARAPGAGPSTGPESKEKDLVGVRCTECGEEIFTEEAKKFLAHERSLQLLSDALEQDRIDAESVDDFISAVFKQHWLGDQTMEKLALFYRRKARQEDRQRALRHRCEFHAAAYPGLSGMLAWTLEAWADAIPVTAQRHDLEEAERSFKEALRILALLYGEKDEEHVAGLRMKLQLVQQALVRAGAVTSKAVVRPEEDDDDAREGSGGANKKRRLRGKQTVEPTD